MSTRDEILEALTDYPEGLTSKELAPKCPACECDPQIVGKTIATLRAEGVIHPGTELRDGGAVWVFGRQAPEPQAERVTLPYQPPPKSAHLSEAAREIAAMRDRAPIKTATTPSPARPAVHQEESMTVTARIEAALKKHGPMTTREMREHVTADHLAVAMANAADRGVLKKLGGGKGSTIYGVPGQTLKDAKQPAPPQSEKPKTDALERGAELGRKAKKAAKAPKAKRERTPRAAITPLAPKPLNGFAQYAINELGELGIEKEVAKLKLDKEEFYRLREFIERTASVWKGAE